MSPDDDMDRCPLCHEKVGFTVTANGWVRLFCAPCQFSWTDRVEPTPGRYSPRGSRSDRAR